MADGLLLYKTKGGKEIRSGSLKILFDYYQDKLSKSLEGSNTRQQAAVNAMIRVALDDAGKMWVAVFLPLRFTNYSKNLGYFANAYYEAMKVSAAREGRPLRFKQERDISGGEDINSGIVLSPQPTPFVASGQSRELCLASAKVETRVTKDRGRILIRCNVGVIKFTRQYQAFLTIPAIERQRVSDQIKRNLELILSQSGPSAEKFNSQFRWTSQNGRPLRETSPNDERTVG